MITENFRVSRGIDGFFDLSAFAVIRHYDSESFPFLSHMMEHRHKSDTK